MKSFKEYITEAADFFNKDKPYQLNVTKAPSANTIKKGSMGWSAEKLSDKDLVDAYKNAETANYLIRNFSKQPEWASKSSNTHVLTQNGKPELIDKIKAEMDKRGMNIAIDIEIKKS